MKFRRKITKEKEIIKTHKYDFKLLINIVVLWSSMKVCNIQWRLSAFVIKVS